MFSTLGQPRKWCGFCMLFATGITCNDHNQWWMKDPSDLAAGSGGATRLHRACVHEENLQRRYLRWRISQSRRTAAAARPTRTAWRCRATARCWRCSRVWSKSRISWRCSPTSRMEPYTWDCAPGRAVSVPELATEYTSARSHPCRYGNPLPEEIR